MKCPWCLQKTTVPRTLWERGGEREPWQLTWLNTSSGLYWDCTLSWCKANFWLMCSFKAPLWIEAFEADLLGSLQRPFLMHPLNVDDNTIIGTPKEKPSLQTDPFVAGNVGTGTRKQIKVTRFLISPNSKGWPVHLLASQPKSHFSSISLPNF